VKLAADANPLLAAVLGGRAALILCHPNVEAVFTTEETNAEVEEYAPVLAAEKGLYLDQVLLAVASLPVQIVERSAYENRIAEAGKLISQRDQDDIPSSRWP
jgi:predicted nucleic acid-binding protein